MTTPKVGQYLWASCSAEDYGKIIAVGKDANDYDVIDIEVFNANDLIDCEENDSRFQNSITRLELPPNTTAILRDLQWLYLDEVDGVTRIVCNTPGNGCYRCTKLFWLHDTAS